MIDDRDMDLMNREIDGLNSAEETAALLARLHRDPQAREFYDELVKLQRLLKCVEPVEPPRYLKNVIVNSIPFRRPLRAPARLLEGLRGETHSNFWTRIPVFQRREGNRPITHNSFISQGGSMRKKSVTLSLIASAAFAIVYFAFVYPWPASEQVQGTIGGVKKYNAGQLSDKDVKLAESSTSQDPLSTMEQRINAMEGRLAPEARQEILQARIQYVESRIGVPAESRLAGATLEARLQQAEQRVMSRAAGLPTEQRLALVEAMMASRVFERVAASNDQRIAAANDQRSASTVEERLSAVESRLAIPQDSRTSTIESRLQQAESRVMERSASLPAEQRISSLESRLGTTPESRQAILEARLSNIESRLSIPSESRNSTLESRINNVESRYAVPQDQRQMQ